MSEVIRHRPWGDSVPTEFVLASDYDQLKAENEVLTLRVMAGERQELDALKSAPVVMPEHKELSIYADEEFYRWLEQLPDEAARLNRSKT